MGKMKLPASVKMVNNMMDNWWSSKQRCQLYLPAVSNIEKPAWKKSYFLKFPGQKHLMLSYNMLIYKASAVDSRMDAISLIYS